MFILYALELHTNLMVVLISLGVAVLLTIIFFFTQRSLKEGQVPRYVN